MDFKLYIPHKKFKLLSEFLLDLFSEIFDSKLFTIQVHNADNIIIESLKTEHIISFPLLFFNQEYDEWLKSRSAQNWGLNFFNVKKIKDLPVFFGGNLSSNLNTINIDFIGTIFFLQQRYHELVETLPKDQYGRIFAKKSFLVRNGLHTKPWADIYKDLLIDILNEKLELNISQNKTFQIMPSHDVDRPFEYLDYTYPYLLKRLTGDVIRNSSWTRMAQRINKFKKVKSGRLDLDPFNTFDWIMEQSEKNSLESTFHFITEVTNSKYDHTYKLSDSEIQKLIKEIHYRGHKIALHPSFESTKISGQVAREFAILKEEFYEYTKTYKLWKSRNHYLRWNNSFLSELEVSGIDIDQTLGFAEVPGFRCGTCNRFKAYNFEKSEFSRVFIEPLILMEVSLFDANYLNLSNNLTEAWNIASSLKEECRRYNGNFTILWHNNNLVDKMMKEFYSQCISWNV